MSAYSMAVDLGLPVPKRADLTTWESVLDLAVSAYWRNRPVTEERTA